VAQVTQLRLLAVALLVQPRVRIGARFMRLVRALLAAEVRAIAVVGAVLGAKALLRSPRLNSKRVVLAGCTSGGAGFRMIVCPKRSLSWMG
jgi:hypothetical protein